MSNLLLDERPIVLQPSLIKLFGFERATVLQQFHWLLEQPRNGKEIDGQRWIWGTYEEWCEDYFPFWEARTLRHHINKLQKTGVLLSCQPNSADWDRTNFYRIDHDKIRSLIGQHVDASEGQSVAPSEGQQDDTSEGQHVDASLYRTKRSTERSKTKRSTKKSSLANDDDQPPSSLLRSLIEGAGFIYFDKEFTEIATRLEVQYATEQLVRAVASTKAAHQKKIDKGERGITAPLAYVAQVLADEPVKPAARTKQRFRIPPDQYSTEEKYVEI